MTSRVSVWRHARAYLDYYPRDTAFARTVAETLRGAGEVQSALAVERPGREPEREGG